MCLDAQIMDGGIGLAGGRSACCRWPSCWRSRSGSAPPRCCPPSPANGPWATAGRAGLTIAVQAGFIVGTLAAALTNLPDVLPARALMMWGALAGAVANAVLALWVEHLGARARAALRHRRLPGRHLPARDEDRGHLVPRGPRARDRPPGGRAHGGLGRAAPHPRPHRSALAPHPARRLGGRRRWAPSRSRSSPRGRIAFRPPASTCAWPPRCCASAGRGWPASATSGTCGSSTRCGPGWPPSWPRASRRAAAAATRGSMPARPPSSARGWPAASAPGPAARSPTAGAAPRSPWRPWRSPACARVLIGLTFGGPPLLTLLVAVVWGVTVIADSAQFSTAVTELAPASLRRHRAHHPDLPGLRADHGLHLADPPGGRLASAGAGRSPLLAVGPALGVVAMARLRAMPEARPHGGRPRLNRPHPGPSRGHHRGRRRSTMKTIKDARANGGLALTLGLTLGPITMPAPAAAVSAPSGIDARIRLDWEAGPGAAASRRSRATSTTTTVARPRTSTCWWRRSTPPAR